MAHAVAQADQLQRRRRVLQALPLLQVGELERQLHVLHGRQHREQIELLENEAHVLVAPVGDLAVAQLAQVVAEHADVPAGGTIHGGDQVQQRRLARSRWPHQGHEFAFVDAQAHVLQRDYVELVAHVLLSQVAGFNDDFAHNVAAFWRTASPSFNPGGGLVIRSSPPTSPCSTRTPCVLVAPVFTARRKALPSNSTKTEPSRRAAAGTMTTGRAAESSTLPGFAGFAAFLAAFLAAFASAFSSAAKATLAFISGRKYPSGWLIFTLICTVAFWRLASGEISLMKPSYLRSGNASVVTAPCCWACSLAKSFCAISSSTSRSFRSARETT